MSERRFPNMKWRTVYLRALYVLVTIAALVLASSAQTKWH